jgi:hypothetical protein
VLAAADPKANGILANSACRLRRLGVNHFIVGAFSSAVYQFCQESVIMAFPATKSVAAGSAATTAGDAPGSFEEAPSGSKGNGSDGVDSSSFATVETMATQISRILAEGLSLVWAEPDIFFVRDPLPVLSASPADVVLLPAGDASEQFSTRFMYIRYSDVTVALFQVLIMERARRPTVSESALLNELVCGVDGNFAKTDEVSSGRACVNPTLKLTASFLPPSSFLDATETSSSKSLHDLLSDFSSPKDLYIVITNPNPAAAREELQQAKLWSLDKDDECAFYNRTAFGPSDASKTSVTLSREEEMKRKDDAAV